MGHTLSTSFVWQATRAQVSEESERREEEKRSEGLQVGVVHDQGALPVRATSGAAGFDVCSAEDVSIAPWSRALVNTGTKLVMPNNIDVKDSQVVMFATLKGRSGLAKRGIDVHPGTIDCDYRGLVKAVVINNTEEEFKIKKGDRIAQLIFGMALVPIMVSLNRVEEADETARGEGGFGSTGVDEESVAPVEPEGPVEPVAVNIVQAEEEGGDKV
jgi:dUTP pyrophosphatase